MVDTTAFGRWNYTADSFTDSVELVGTTTLVGGTNYELYGAAFMETADRVFIAINTNFPLDGVEYPPAEDDRIRWGDAIFNFTNLTSLSAANNASALSVVRFDALNESRLAGSGVFQNATLTSVAKRNGLILASNRSDDLAGYISIIDDAPDQEHGFGDLPPDTTYFDRRVHLHNVGVGGTRAGGVVVHGVDDPALSGLDFQTFFNSGGLGSGGTYTYAFSIERSAIPSGDFVLHLAPECANDIIAVTGRLGTPDLDIVKKVNGSDSNSPETAIGVLPGSTLTYSFEVRNTGSVGIHYDDLNLTDDQIPFNYRDLPLTGDTDGNRILTSDEVWTFTVQTVAEDQSVTLDFDSNPLTGLPFAPGTPITDQYQNEYGLTISTLINENGPSTDVIADRGAMIFDSANPPRADEDLRTSDQGNILILSEDGNPESPNDNHEGGTFTFTWADVVQIRSIDLVDIEESSGQIFLYRDGVLVGVEGIPLEGTNSYQSLDLDNVLIDRMDVVIEESGAIANINFSRFHRNTATLTSPVLPGEREEDSSYYTAANPDIAIIKRINGEDADTLETAYTITPGTEATFTYVVTNTGNIPFNESELLVQDDQIGVLTGQTIISKGNGDTILDPGESWEYQVAATVNNLRRTIDFETNAVGETLDRGVFTGTEYREWGLNISRVGRRQQNGLMIFDTGTPTGDDDDLFSTNLDNVLILSEDGDAEDPDDEAGGGTFRLDFDELVRIHQVGVFDIDENQNNSGGFIRTFDANNREINRYNIAAVGDNEFQEVAIGDELVSRMEITLLGSGSISGLEYEQRYRNQGSVTVQAPYNLIATDMAFANTFGV